MISRTEKTEQQSRRKKILKIYSRWISNLKPCSIPDSGIKVCSARHDKNFPWSSSVGWYVKIDLVKFPSDDVCADDGSGGRRAHAKREYKIIISSPFMLLAVCFCSPIHELFAAVRILSTMKSAVLAGIPSPRTSSRTNDSLINTLHLDLILSLMDALIILKSKKEKVQTRIRNFFSLWICT